MAKTFWKASTAALLCALFIFSGMAFAHHASNPEPFSLMWKNEEHGQDDIFITQKGSPIVLNKERISRLSANTGKVIWSIANNWANTVVNFWSNSFADHCGKIMLFKQDTLNLVCVNEDDGKILWETKVELKAKRAYDYSCIKVVDNTIVLYDYVNIYCIDVSNGLVKLIIERGSFFRIDLFGYADKIYIATDHEIECVSEKTWETVWNKQMYVWIACNKSIYIHLSGAKIFINTELNTVLTLACLDAKTGEVLWALGGEPGYIISSGFDEIYTISIDYTADKTIISCLSKETGALKWHKTVDGMTERCLVFPDKAFFVTFSSKKEPNLKSEVICLSETNGDLLWAIDTDMGPQCCIYQWNGCVLATDSHVKKEVLKISVLDPATGDELWGFDERKKSLCTLTCFCQARFYVQLDGGLYCYGDPSETFPEPASLIGCRKLVFGCSLKAVAE